MPSVRGDNDITGAYNRLTGIPGIRSSFFTKHLYFTGNRLNPAGEFPLILDTMVARSLAWLTGVRPFRQVR